MNIDEIPVPEKTYLGDGVYAGHDGYHIVLTAENGLAVTNTVYLDPGVWANLQRTVARWVTEAGQAPR